jgi:hypothetical protein
MQKRIRFLLDENFHRCLRGASPWNMVDDRAQNDPPIDLEEDNRFFIVNSRTRKIYGPFVPTAPQYYNKAGASYAVKERGTPEVSYVICHMFTPFERANISMQAHHGLPWKRAAEILDVHESAWLNLKALEMSDEQFELLCAGIEQAHTDKMLQAIDDIVIVQQGDEVDEYDYSDNDAEDFSYEGFVREHYGRDLTDEQIEEIADSDNQD